jgi:hypothetical protein
LRGFHLGLGLVGFLWLLFFACGAGLQQVPVLFNGFGGFVA